MRHCIFPFFNLVSLLCLIYFTWDHQVNANFLRKIISFVSFRHSSTLFIYICLTCCFGLIIGSIPYCFKVVVLFRLCGQFRTKKMKSSEANKKILVAVAGPRVTRSDKICSSIES